MRRLRDPDRAGRGLHHGRQGRRGAAGACGRRCARARIGRRRTFDGLADQFLPTSTTRRPSRCGWRTRTSRWRRSSAASSACRCASANLALEEMTEALNRGWGDRDSRSPMLLQHERAGVEDRGPRGGAEGRHRARREIIIASSPVRCSATEGAQPRAHAPRDPRRLGRCDSAPRNRGQDGLQCPPGILRGVNGGEVDTEPLGRVDLAGGRRQDLRRERPQQMRLAVEEQRQGGVRVVPERTDTDKAPLRVRNARRPAGRVAGTPLREPPALVPRARAARSEKRSGPSCCDPSNSACGIQVKAGRTRWTDGRFRHGEARRRGNLLTCSIGVCS